MADISAVTQIEITGKDSTGPAFAGVKDGLKQVENSARDLRDWIGNLAGAVSIGMFASAIKEAIDYADNLNDLAKRTGITVETLGGLGYAAQTAGVDLETVAKGSQKLANLMAEAASGNDKAAATFASMGVSVTAADGSLADMGETLYSVADRFASYADGPEKAALAQEIFGKSGAALIPLLNEGGEKLREMVEEYRTYGGVTTETAQRADAFNDTMAKLQMMSGALMQELASALLPTLQAIADVFVDVKVKGEGFSGVAGVLVNVVKGIGIAAVGVVAVFDVLGKSLGALAAAAVQLAQGNFKQAWETLKEGGSDAATTVSTAIERATKIWDASTVQIAATTDTNMTKTKAPIVKVNDELKKQKDELDKLQAKWAAFGAAQESGMATQTIKDLEELNKLLDAGRIQWDRYNELMEAVIDKDPVLAKEQEAINKVFKETTEIIDKVNEAWAKDLKALDDQIAKQENANKTLGQGKAALLDLTIAQLENTIALERSGDAYSPYAEQLEEVRKRMIALRDATQLGEALTQQKKDLDDSKKYWGDTLKSIDDYARATFTGLFDNTKSTWENMWKSMKTTALNLLYELTARPFVIQLAASVGGSLGLSGLAEAATGAGSIAGGLGGFGDIAKGLGSLFTGTMSLGTAFSNLGTILPTFTTMLEGGAAVGEALSASFAGMGASFGAVVPVVGAVIAAGTLIYNWLESKKGGPKEGGFATTGPTPGIGGVDSTGRWFTPAGSDPAMVQAVSAINAQYQMLLEALGGTGSAVFAQGFSTDPLGTAPSNVHTGVFTGTGQVFDAANGNVGRSPEELKAELEAQSMRAILAALQASALPTVIADYLASIDVSTATVEQITAALQHAAELKVLVDQVAALPEEMANGLINALGASPELDQQIADFAVKFKEFSDAADELHEALARNPVQEASDRLAAASETVYEKVGRLRGGLEESLAAYDGSTEGTKALTAATNEYINAQVDALIQIENIRNSLNDMFGETARTFDLAVMNAEQQKQFFIDEALATVKLLEQATDPAEIDRLSRIVNEDLTRAFGLMDPDEQQVQHEYLQSILDDAQATAETQLDLAHNAVIEAGQNAETILANINTAVNAAADKQAAAADLLIEAANLLKDAANRNAQAAETNQAAANTQAQAATTQAQAAATPVTVAPIDVLVTVDYGASGP